MITFHNPGHLPALAITTLGVNAKDDDSAIGYFGTGLKYAIAVILRNGGKINIQSGNEHHSFGVQTEEHRGKQFNIVTLNEGPLGFTTDLGKNWELWMAYRELYCNALDEGGSVTDNKHKHKSSGTTVTVECPGFPAVHMDRNSIVLDNEAPYQSLEHALVHRGSNSRIYFKRVRIYETQKPCLYTYDIKDGLDITEDRTAKYHWEIYRAIVRSVVQSTDREFIRDAITSGRSFVEGDLDYADTLHSGRPSEEFLDEAEASRFDIGFNLSIMKVLAKWNRLPPPESVELTPIQQRQLDKAKDFCLRLGYLVTSYPIIISPSLKDGMLGLAEDKTIYLSPDIFECGTKYVVHGLIEEYMHLVTGFGDETRELQTYLFRQIIGLGEQLLQEPL